jgi:serine/threonine protein kinase
VYSLGVVLYELISGTPPFTASTAEELSRLHMYAEPLPISEYVPDISTELEQIVMKVLDKEPRDATGRQTSSAGCAEIWHGPRGGRSAPARMTQCHAIQGSTSSQPTNDESAICQHLC